MVKIMTVMRMLMRRVMLMVVDVSMLSVMMATMNIIRPDSACASYPNWHMRRPCAPGEVGCVSLRWPSSWLVQSCCGLVLVSGWPPLLAGWLVLQSCWLGVWVGKVRDGEGSSRVAGGGGPWGHGSEHR